MKILGLSSFRHDTAAALLVDGRCVAAIENAKLARAQASGLPDAAIRFCLEQAGLAWRDLDAIAIATQPVYGWARRFLRTVKPAGLSPLAVAYYHLNELGRLAPDLCDLKILRCRQGSSGPCLTFDHHLSHAATTFYLSPFDRALVLTLDEDGDGQSGLIAVGEGARIRPIKRIPFPHSLAWVYSRTTELLGFVPRREEHKTQWLSLQGEPAFKKLFLEMFRGRDDVLPFLRSSFIHRGVTGGLALSASFLEQAGVSGREPMGEEQRCALASSVQHACTELIGDLIAHYLKREQLQHVCLGGGLFQNALLVFDLERRLGAGTLFVPPAPGNSGSAFGAAMLAWHERSHVRCEPASANYWGPDYGAHEIRDLLVSTKSHFSLQNTIEQKLDETVCLLQAGKAVGWFQGRAEFGSRALGNRSLLASPWAPYVQENVNDFIKHREWFRPMAISVPEENSPRYFSASPLCVWMSSLASVRDQAQEIPKEFCLPGNRVRLHLVKRSSNPLFWNLLKRFGESAPAPMLLNTSFNVAGEPLVTRPQDAMRSYSCSGVDALVMENFLLTKDTTRHVLAKSRAV